MHLCKNKTGNDPHFINVSILPHQINNSNFIFKPGPNSDQLLQIDSHSNPLSQTPLGFLRSDLEPQIPHRIRSDLASITLIPKFPNPRVCFYRGIESAWESVSHVLWGGGVGPVADPRPDCVSPVPILLDSRRLPRDPRWDEGVAAQSRLLLRFRDRYGEHCDGMVRDWIDSSQAGYMLYIIERAKKCLDFSATLYIIHLFISTLYGGWPSSITWWVVNGTGLAVMALLGEYLCIRRELREIPITRLRASRRIKLPYVHVVSTLLMPMSQMKLVKRQLCL
ncbi:SYS1-like protein [Drosera capensis]